MALPCEITTFYKADDSDQELSEGPLRNRSVLQKKSAFSFSVVQEANHCLLLWFAHHRWQEAHLGPLIAEAVSNSFNDITTLPPLNRK